MIRYRTRDLTRLLPGTARSMRRMEKITGRSDDMIILRGVNVFPTQIEEQILKCARPRRPHFQIELMRKGRMDNMVVMWSPRRRRRTRLRGPPRQRNWRITSRASSGCRRRSRCMRPGRLWLGPRARRSEWWTTGRRNDLRTKSGY